jgi:hypothetical protein
MAELTLLFRPTPAKIDSLVLDASITESHVGEVEVTEHPVEKGAAISDHSRPRPDLLTIEGLVSNTPLNLTQAQRAGAAQGTEQAIQGQPGYAEAAYAILRDLRETGKLITVVTALRTYDNMVMVQLTVPRSAKTGEALRFTAQFKQVRVVQNKVTTITVAKEPKARGKTSTGKQVGKPTEEAKDKSALKGLSDATGGTDFLKKLGAL